MEWPDGTRFDGHWRHGERWGDGSLTLVGGDIVRGLWRADRLIEPAPIGPAPTLVPLDGEGEALMAGEPPEQVLPPARLR
jgi:hypothetical protein